MVSNPLDTKAAADLHRCATLACHHDRRFQLQSGGDEDRLIVWCLLLSHKPRCMLGLSQGINELLTAVSETTAVAAEQWAWVQGPIIHSIPVIDPRRHNTTMMTNMQKINAAPWLPCPVMSGNPRPPSQRQQQRRNQSRHCRQPTEAVRCARSILACGSISGSGASTGNAASASTDEAWQLLVEFTKKDFRKASSQMLTSPQSRARLRDSVLVRCARVRCARAWAPAWAFGL